MPFRRHSAALFPVIIVVQQHVISLLPPSLNLVMSLREQARQIFHTNVPATTGSAVNCAFQKWWQGSQYAVGWSTSVNTSVGHLSWFDGRGTGHSMADVSFQLAAIGSSAVSILNDDRKMNVKTVAASSDPVDCALCNSGVQRQGLQETVHCHVLF